jgi:hypothetical protein
MVLIGNGKIQRAGEGIQEEAVLAKIDEAPGRQG